MNADPYFAPPSAEATRLRAIEDRLDVLCRFLLESAEKPSPVRKELLRLAGQVQALQRRALKEAARR